MICRPSAIAVYLLRLQHHLGCRNKRDFSKETTLALTCAKWSLSLHLLWMAQASDCFEDLFIYMKAEEKERVRQSSPTH